MKRIYEIFRKTRETFIFIKINIDGVISQNNYLNINIPFLKHMIDQFVMNSNINLDIIVIGDNFIDYHHLIEDIAISLGLILKFSSNIKYIERYGVSYNILEDSKSLVVCDLSKRSYLDYNFFYNRLFVGNLDIDTFYDFFLSIVNNFNINLYIFVCGYNIHHKVECVFKSFGIALKNSLKLNNKIISTKGYL